MKVDMSMSITIDLMLIIKQTVVEQNTASYDMTSKSHPQNYIIASLS